MPKYFVAIFFLVVIGSALSNAYKTTQRREESVLVRPRRDTLEESEVIKIDGKDAPEGSSQGLIATYWNNFLKRARLPMPIWNITNPFTPYVIEINYPPGNSQSQQPNAHLQPANEQSYLRPDGQSLILVDPETQQYYRVQPVA